MNIHEGEQKLVATWLAGSPNSGIAIMPTAGSVPHTPGKSLTWFGRLESDLVLGPISDLTIFHKLQISF